MMRQILTHLVFAIGLGLTVNHGQADPQDILINNPNENNVSFTTLAPNVWMHISYKNIEPWGLVFTNGLIIEKKDYSLLVDTAWNNQQTEQIIDWAKTVLKKPIKASIHTHAHDDKMGGMATLHSHGIDTYAHKMSNKLAPANNLLPARNDLPLALAGDQTQWEGLDVLYPGGGHTRDNIVVYERVNKIIFGGCLIRPHNSDSLGYTGDADIKYWPQAVQNVADGFPHGKLIIPSHGQPAGREILTNTIKIASGSQ